MHASFKLQKYISVKEGQHWKILEIVSHPIRPQNAIICTRNNKKISLVFKHGPVMMASQQVEFSSPIGQSNVVLLYHSEW